MLICPNITYPSTDAEGHIKFQTWISDTTLSKTALQRDTTVFHHISHRRKAGECGLLEIFIPQEVCFDERRKARPTRSRYRENSPTTLLYIRNERRKRGPLYPVWSNLYENKRTVQNGTPQTGKKNAAWLINTSNKVVLHSIRGGSFVFFRKLKGWFRLKC